jgi:phosphate transport system substrate-binding protein
MQKEHKEKRGLSVGKAIGIGFGIGVGLLVLITVGIPLLIIMLISLNMPDRPDPRLIRELEQIQLTGGVSQNIDLWDYVPFRQDTETAARIAMLPESEESTLKFSRLDELPRLDGATALFPVYAAFVQAVYPELNFRTEQAENHSNRNPSGYIPGGGFLVRCTTTGTAYENLINGRTDIIFVAGISDEHAKLAASRGIELEFTPIGRDAFVFFVHARNPVESLTTEQIRGIYSGEITNWQELGGEDAEIIAYQREANSGSQTAMENLMGDKPLARRHTEDVVEYAMDAMIFQVEATTHRNFPNAMGYSFLFFAAEMLASERIRLLSIDGVEPNRENIANGTYSHSGYFYAVTVAGKSDDNPNIALFVDWILSEQGQYLIEKTGYNPL